MQPLLERMVAARPQRWRNIGGWIYVDSSVKPAAQMKSTGDRKPFNIPIAFLSFVFVAVLAVAAYWDRTIRLLHLFESLPYLVAATLCLRNRMSGYILAFASGAFWLWTAGTLTTFVGNGFERLAVLVTTGRLDRPDILIAVPAAISTAGLVVFGLWSYWRLPDKQWRDLGTFTLALALVTGWFVGIFALFAPRYLGMFRRLLP